MSNSGRGKRDIVIDLFNFLNAAPSLRGNSSGGRKR